MIMICVLDENNQIINIVNTDIITADNERQHYPWNQLWEQYTDVMPFEYAKDAKITEAKAIRDTSEVAPIEYNGNIYDFDAKSRDRLDIALKALTAQGDCATLEWTMADNTTAVITASDIMAVFVTSAVRSNELHEQYRLAKEQINAAQTVEELDGIEVIGNE